MVARQPQVSYVIVDFPEVLALQYLFLKLSAPEIFVSLGDSADPSRSLGTVTLMPVSCAADVKAKGHTTLFTSHFALNESGGRTVEGVVSRRFFGTTHAWIALPRAGLETWGTKASIPGG